MTPAARTKRARKAANHRHMCDRLVRAYVRSEDDTRAEGRRWYPNAEANIASLAEAFGLGRPAVAGIVAALSPQQKWRTNLNSARLVLEGRVPSGYGSNRRKAEALRDGASPFDVLGGDKVTSFWANLIGSGETVTVDVWAQRAATGKDLPPPSGPRYRAIADAYRAAATIVGETPRDFQAIIWLATRPQAEHRRDVEALA